MHFANKQIDTESSIYSMKHLKNAREMFPEVLHLFIYLFVHGKKYTFHLLFTPKDKRDAMFGITSLEMEKC